MFFTLAVVGLYVLGVVWCYQVIGRFREDVQEIREVKEGARRGAIIFIWVLTVIIAVVLIGYGLAVMRQMASLFRVFGCA